MIARNTLRACAIAGALASASVSGVLAQGGFTINGRVKVDGGSLDDTRLVVYKNGEKQRTVNNGLGKFSLDLDLNSDYVLSFEKEGFVTKKLSFDTHAPAEAITNGFTPFEFAVSIFKQYDDVNTVVFNQPVGMIRYDKISDDFDYDTDYTKSIQSALEKTLQEVAQKQAQEKEKDAAEAKRKEAEAKVKAKAEADKQKQEAEANKLAAKDQEKKDAEAKKVEAAAKKAEQDRLAEEAKKPKEKPKPEPKPDPPPAPVAKARAPKPKPDPVKAHRNVLHGQPHQDAEARRSQAPKEVSDPSPVRPATANEMSEARPKFEPSEPSISRHEELIVEANQVITLIRLDDGRAKTEFRKVVHKYGSVFYFKDGQSCTKLIYETEALADNK